MFGLIIGAISLIAGIASGISKSVQEKKQAETQAEQTKLQYDERAKQAYQAGISQIGDLQVGLATSGVKFNAEAGQATLDEAADLTTPSLAETVGGGIGGNVGAVASTIDSATLGHGPGSATQLSAASRSRNYQDTASMILGQSRRNLAHDVEMIQQTGDYQADAIEEQGKQNLYSNIFGTASNALSVGAQFFQTW